MAKRKTLQKQFSGNEDDFKIINSIIKRAEDYDETRLNYSLVLRMGLRLVEKLSDKQIISLANKTPKPRVGRPPTNN